MSTIAEQAPLADTLGRLGALMVPATVADARDRRHVSGARLYVRLARREEHEALGRFGPAYADYMARVLRWIPRLGGSALVAGGDRNSRGG